VDPDPAAVAFDDVLADREADARARKVVLVIRTTFEHFKS
jgi:hypothetical protein